MLTANEMEMAAALLAMASEDFGNHGCNDYEIPNTPDNAALAEWAPGEFAPLNDDKTQIIATDWMLMTRLAKKLHAESERLR